MKALQKEISTLKSTNSRITAENKSLASSLTESQNEAKSMSARLSALRAQSAEPPKITNGATKQRGGPSVSNSQPGFKDGDWQLKKDLFEDLTGLVVTNVKKSDGDIVYHCLQTGKNGGKHILVFKRPAFHSTLAEVSDLWQLCNLSSLILRALPLATPGMRCSLSTILNWMMPRVGMLLCWKSFPIS